MVNQQWNQVSFFRNNLPKSGRLLGLDIGSKKIGIALSDPERFIATPLKLLKRSSWKKDSMILLDIIQKWSIFGCVVGWPLYMIGALSPRTQASEQFCYNLSVLKPDLLILLWDERYTTKAAERFLISCNVSRKKRKEKVDQIAACFILQTALERLRDGEIIFHH